MYVSVGHTSKSKSKIIRANLVPCRENRRGRGSLAPRILKFGTRRKIPYMSARQEVGWATVLFCTQSKEHLTLQRIEAQSPSLSLVNTTTHPRGLNKRLNLIVKKVSYVATGRFECPQMRNQLLSLSRHICKGPQSQITTNAEVQIQWQIKLHTRRI
jgi:hypothetical protein